MKTIKTITTNTTRGYPELDGRLVDVMEAKSGYVSYAYPIMYGSARDTRRTKPKQMYGRIISQAAGEIFFVPCTKKEMDVAIGKEIIFNQVLDEMKAKGMIEESADGSMIRLSPSYQAD